MILSEEQATETTCPFMVDGVTGEPIKCLGTGCMSWRWALEKQTSAYLDDVAAYMRETGKAWNLAVQYVWAEKRGTYRETEGYCCRVGRPSNEAGQ